MDGQDEVLELRVIPQYLYEADEGCDGESHGREGRSGLVDVRDVNAVKCGFSGYEENGDQHNTTREDSVMFRGGKGDENARRFGEVSQCEVKRFHSCSDDVWGLNSGLIN